MTNEPCSAAPTCAVYYVTDELFALPTLVSACAVRRWIAPARADIRIVAIDIPAERFEALAEFLAPLNIALDSMDSRVFSNFDLTKFNKTHVPRATLGRFFMLDASPAQYDHIVYIDGDTWINADPGPLVEFRPPDGFLGAVEGPTSYYRHDISAHGRETRRYLDGIGLSSGDGYFNAGVLCASAQTWRTVAAEAFAFFRDNTERCKYHDESALNAVAAKRRITLSHRWNFMSPYRDWGVETALSPAIYHFTGAPKPWVGAFAPWQELYQPYRDALAPFSALGLPLSAPTADDVRQGEINVRNEVKLRSVLAWRKFNRQRAFSRVENSASVRSAGHDTLRASA